MDGSSAAVITKILHVLFPAARSVCDPTYGRGNFYKELPTSVRLFGGDIDIRRARNWRGDCCTLPFADGTFDCAVLDIPFQPISTNTSQLIGDQYSKVGVVGQSMANLAQVRDLLITASREAHRVSRLGTIIKTQDYVHARKVVSMTAWMHEALGLPGGHVTLRQASKLRSSSWRTQCSVWTNHSDFWIYFHGSRYARADSLRMRERAR